MNSLASKCSVSERTRGHENVEWQTAYSYHLTDDNRNLPRVLLVGDSICNAYQAGVRNALEGTANVSFWVSSCCVMSANYLKLLSVQLSESRFDVIHFNNGLHSLLTPMDDRAVALRSALKIIRSARSHGPKSSGAHRRHLPRICKRPRS